jgi:hypothetical protein
MRQCLMKKRVFPIQFLVPNRARQVGKKNCHTSLLICSRFLPLKFIANIFIYLIVNRFFLNFRQTLVTSNLFASALKICLLSLPCDCNANLLKKNLSRHTPCSLAGMSIVGSIDEFFRWLRLVQAQHPVRIICKKQKKEESRRFSSLKFRGKDVHQPKKKLFMCQVKKRRERKIKQ